MLTHLQKSFFDKIQPGDCFGGTVKNISHYGAFINIGLLDGLVHKKDISWGRVKDPADFLKLRQKTEVMLLKKDTEKFRLLFGMKQLHPHPWELAKEKFKEGDTVIGHVVEVVSFGAFLEVFPGFEGLVHVSEISDKENIKDARSFFKPDQSFEATILKLDFEQKKMALSIK